MKGRKQPKNGREGNEHVIEMNICGNMKEKDNQQVNKTEDKGPVECTGYQEKESHLKNGASFLRKKFRNGLSYIILRLMRVASYLDVRAWSFRKYMSVGCLVASWVSTLIGFSVHNQWGATKIVFVGGGLILAYYVLFCAQSLFYFFFRQNEFSRFLGNLLLGFADQFLVHEELWFQISYFCRQASLLLQLNHYRIEEYEDEFDPIMIKLLAFHMLTKGLEVFSKKQHALAAQYGVTGLVGLLCIFPVADLKTVLKKIFTQPWYLLLWMEKVFDSWVPGIRKEGLTVADEVKNTTVSGPESSISKDGDEQLNKQEDGHYYGGVLKEDDALDLEGLHKNDKRYGDDGVRKRSLSLKIT